MNRFIFYGFTVFLWGAVPLSVLAQEGGIEVFSGGTLFEGGTRVSVTQIWQQKEDLYSGSSKASNPTGRSHEEFLTVLGVDYGLLPELTLSGLVPWSWQEESSSTANLRSSGLSDIALLAKYRMYKVDWKRSTFNVSIIGGVELPTGSTSERDDGARLSPGLQPGFGAWNSFLVLSPNLNLDRFRFDAHFFVKQNSEGAQDFERGDFWSVELDGAYRFYHTPYPGPTASAKIGVQWRAQGRDEQNGVDLSNTGGDEVRFRMGLTWHPDPGTDATLQIDLPLSRDLHGTQLAFESRIVLGYGIRF